MAVSNEDIYLAGAGIVKSSDGGTSWTEINNGLGAGRLEIIPRPGDPFTVLIGGETQVERSVDGGFTWSPYANTAGSKVAYSSDGMLYYEEDGELYLKETSYTTKRLTQPAAGGLDALIAHPILRNRVFALYADTSPYLFASDDAGQSWHSIRIGPLPSGRLFFDHEEGKRVYAFGEGSSAFYRSDDYGESWRSCFEAKDAFQEIWSSPTATKLIVDPRNPDHLLLATRGAGVLVSEDGCKTWQASNYNLWSLFVNSLAYDSRDPDIIYAGTDGGAYVSFDDGQAWNQINNGLLGATTVYGVAEIRSYIVANTPYGIFMLEKK
jgi:photosystem II stability/assembly factor-like uncharacterized protein